MLKKYKIRQEAFAFRNGQTKHIKTGRVMAKIRLVEISSEIKFVKNIVTYSKPKIGSIDSKKV